MAKETTPAWLVKRYMKLWNKFKDKTFSFDEAKKTLGEDNKFLSVVLSEMKKERWLSLELDPEDARKRLYKLLSLEEVMKKTAEKAVNIFREESSHTVKFSAGRDINISSNVKNIDENSKKK